MKLELKHLAAYLPYRLKVAYYFGDVLICISPMVASMVSNSFAKEIPINSLLENDGHFKPILRPLSDLFKLIDWDETGDPYMIGYKFGVEEAEEDGVGFYAQEYYANYCESPKCNIDITSINWWLFEYHFDIFGLIDAGLAIDVNTLNENPYEK